MKTFKLIPFLLLFADCGNARLCTEENTENVYPLEQWQTNGLRRRSLSET